MRFSGCFACFASVNIALLFIIFPQPRSSLSCCFLLVGLAVSYGAGWCCGAVAYAPAGPRARARFAFIGTRHPTPYAVPLCASVTCDWLCLWRLWPGETGGAWRAPGASCLAATYWWLQRHEHAQYSITLTPSWFLIFEG